MKGLRVMDKSFLPLGSIVLLKDATRKIVIVGYLVKEESNNKYWDYLGAPYPLGVIDPNKNLLFDREQIDKVVFTGYSDEEGKKVIDFLNEKSKEKNG